MLLPDEIGDGAVEAAVGTHPRAHREPEGHPQPLLRQRQLWEDLGGCAYGSRRGSARCVGRIGDDLDVLRRQYKGRRRLDRHRRWPLRSPGGRAVRRRGAVLRWLDAHAPRLAASCCHRHGGRAGAALSRWLGGRRADDLDVPHRRRRRRAARRPRGELRRRAGARPAHEAGRRRADRPLPLLERGGGPLPAEARQQLAAKRDEADEAARRGDGGRLEHKLHPPLEDDRLLEAEEDERREADQHRREEGHAALVEFGEDRARRPRDRERREAEERLEGQLHVGDRCPRGARIVVELEHARLRDERRRRRVEVEHLPRDLVLARDEARLRAVGRREVGAQDDGVERQERAQAEHQAGLPRGGRRRRHVIGGGGPSGQPPRRPGGGGGRAALVLVGGGHVVHRPPDEQPHAERLEAERREEERERERRPRGPEDAAGGRRGARQQQRRRVEQDAAHEHERAQQGLHAFDARVAPP